MLRFASSAVLLLERLEVNNAKTEEVRQAVFDQSYVDTILAEFRKGDANVGTARTIDSWARTVRSQLSKGTGNIDALLGGSTDKGDAEVYGRASRRKPIDALRNCLNNLQLDQNEILGSPSPELSQARDSITQDSTGRELTKEQQEFFKDSKARDAKGRLLTCTTDPTLPELYSIPEML